MKEPDLGERPAVRLLQNLGDVRALHLESIGVSPSWVGERLLVALDLHVVATGAGVELNPIPDRPRSLYRGEGGQQWYQSRVTPHGEELVRDDGGEYKAENRREERGQSPPQTASEGRYHLRR